MSTAFGEMYGGLLQIAAANVGRVEAAGGEGWNTSMSKLVDNAMVGYMLADGAVPEASA